MRGAVFSRFWTINRNCPCSIAGDSLGKGIQKGWLPDVIGPLQHAKSEVVALNTALGQEY